MSYFHFGLVWINFKKKSLQNEARKLFDFVLKIII